MRVISFFLVVGSISFFFSACISPETKKYREAFEVYKERRLKKLSEGGLEAPVNAETKDGIRYFTYSPEYRVDATYEKIAKPLAFEIPTTIGQTKEYRPFGYLHFELKNKKHRLTLYQDITAIERSPGNDNWYYLAMPFMDKTTGKSTDSNGRLMHFDRRKIEKTGKITIDFNTAYNQHCAYRDRYLCPIPQEENRLSIAIKAGEKAFKK